MSTDTSVKLFDSTMTGAPAITDANGTVIAALRACLVNGFGGGTADTLVVSDNVATLTLSAGHGFSMYGDTGPVILVAGATPSSLNGEWRVQTVPSAATLTFTTSGISNQTATGTITVKRAPAGWTEEFTGTNIVAFRNSTVGGTGYYVRIQENGVSPASGEVVPIQGYEVMTDVDTGTGPVPPLASPGLICKNYDDTSTARAWKVYADAQAFYLLIRNYNGNNLWYEKTFAGDIVSIVPADAHHFKVATPNAINGGRTPLDRIDNVVQGGPSHIGRAYTQTGTSVATANLGHKLGATYIGVGGYTYPNPGSDSLVVAPIECAEGTTVLRGYMPGFFHPVHTMSASGSYFEGAGALSGRTLYVQDFETASYQYYAVFDVTGPWR